MPLINCAVHLKLGWHTDWHISDNAVAYRVTKRSICNFINPKLFEQLKSDFKKLLTGKDII